MPREAPVMNSVLPLSGTNPLRLSPLRHARPCAGHPRLPWFKSWMAGASPAPTKQGGFSASGACSHSQSVACQPTSRERNQKLPINEGAMQLTGIHPLTAISANAPGNKRFYTGTMGMRMVKKTVNQDDVSAYHLFYADALARPGTDLTFFDWPAPPEGRGTHSIARTALRIAGAESFQWGKEPLH